MGATATFETDGGDPVPAITAAEMREVDRVAVEEVGPKLLQMMENAGRNLAHQVRAVADGPVTVLAGSGGNGGGGLAAARHLANRDVAVTVHLDRPPGELRGAPATQLWTLQAMDVPIRVDEDPQDVDVLVDALVGYGLSGPLGGRAAELVETIPDAATVVSLDVPSGVDATTGETPGPAVTPDVTVTLALPKTGLEAVPGRLVLADIGIPAAVYERACVDYDNPFDADRVTLRRSP